MASVGCTGLTHPTNQKNRVHLLGIIDGRSPERRLLHIYINPRYEPGISKFPSSLVQPFWSINSSEISPSKKPSIIQNPEHQTRSERSAKNGLWPGFDWGETSPLQVTSVFLVFTPQKYCTRVKVANRPPPKSVEVTGLACQCGAYLQAFDGAPQVWPLFLGGRDGETDFDIGLETLVFQFDPICGCSNFWDVLVTNLEDLVGFCQPLNLQLPRWHIKLGTLTLRAGMALKKRMKNSWVNLVQET